MIKLIRNIIRQNEDVPEEMWYDCKKSLKHIKQLFPVEMTEKPEIKDFYCIAAKLNPKQLSAVKVGQENASFTLCLVQYEYVYYTAGKTGGTKHTDVSLYLYGYFPLKRNYGVALIRPETFFDKFGELFNPVEIDFPSHRKFNWKYYVLAEDKDVFKSLLPVELLDYVKDIKGLELEFRNNRCLFRLPKANNVSESRRLCEIGFRLQEILNK